MQGWQAAPTTVHYVVQGILDSTMEGDPEIIVFEPGGVDTPERFMDDYMNVGDTVDRFDWQVNEFDGLMDDPELVLESMGWEVVKTEPCDFGFVGTVKLPDPNPEGAHSHYFAEAESDPASEAWVVSIFPAVWSRFSQQLEAGEPVCFTHTDFPSAAIERMGYQQVTYWSLGNLSRTCIVEPFR